jgi:hypothetical protein
VRGSFLHNNRKLTGHRPTTTLDVGGVGVARGGGEKRFARRRWEPQMKKDLERFLSRFAFFVIYSRVFRMKIGIEAEELSKGVKAAKRRAQISFISLSLTRSAMDEWKEVFGRRKINFLSRNRGSSDMICLSIRHHRWRA